MEEKKFFVENKAFLEEEFRSDLARLIAADKSTLSVMLEEFRSITNYDRLYSDKFWANIAEQTSKTIDDLWRMFHPLHYMALVANKEKIDPSDIISLLIKKGILEGIEPDVHKQILDLVTTLDPLLGTEEAKTLSRLPGLRIGRISGRTNITPEIENEFDATVDSPESYSPKIKCFHVYSHLKLTFVGNENNPITISLTESDLKTLKKILDSMVIEQCTLKEQFPSAEPQQRDSK